MRHSMMNTTLITSLQLCRSRDKSGDREARIGGALVDCTNTWDRICWMIICSSWGIGGAFSK